MHLFVILENVEPVYTYIDYRIFLRDFYNEQKKVVRHFSYRYFNLRAGVTSPVFLKLVIEGKRNLSAKTIPGFCRACQLNKSESIFFRHLVFFNQSKNSSEKQEHYAVLVSMASNVHKKIMGSEQFEYFEKWYHPAIRELVCLENFADDFEKLALTLNPSISPISAKNSVKLLLRLGLLKRESDGTYSQVDRALGTSASITPLAIRSFNKSMISLAAQALDEIPVKQRHASGVTMGISSQCYDVLCDEIEAFKDRIARIVEADRDSDRVYQFNIQFFPLSSCKRIVLSETQVANK